LSGAVADAGAAGLVVTGPGRGGDPASGLAASVYLEQYARGGIFSGMTSLDTWRERLMPMLSEEARTRLPSRPQQTDPDHKPPGTSAGTLRYAVVPGRAADGP
jgi:hypothetical protein